ncbi:MAG: prephenate dehydrogenase dimerization domain-containing protein, partial [Verrucomicrobiota bacterium]
SESQVREIESFWQTLGASTHLLAPADHDRVVARISHLPHAAASMIASAALESDATPVQLSGGGFRDTTRVAAGAPEMWAEILLQNQNEVLSALEDLSANVSEVLEFLRKRDQKNLAAYLARAKELRDLLAE